MSKDKISQGLNCIERVIAPSLERLHEKCIGLGERCDSLGKLVAENTRRIERLSAYVRDKNHDFEARIGNLQGRVQGMKDAVVAEMKVEMVKLAHRLGGGGEADASPRAALPPG